MKDPTQRLDKYLSNAGIASRRNIKKLLKNHILTVNGERIRESGFRIDPKKDILLLEGREITQPQFEYFILNKPKGVISTTSDERGRRNVTSFIQTKLRLYPVGRLDKDTTGLILLTNNGELTHKLIHPKYHIPKIYLLKIKGIVLQHKIDMFKNGVILEDGITSPAIVKIIEENKTSTILQVTLFEGKNRQIRRMCEKLELDLLELSRVAFGNIQIDNLKVGESRELSQDEVQSLQKAVEK